MQYIRYLELEVHFASYGVLDISNWKENFVSYSGPTKLK